jgi:small subunit ribosomal protein S20
MPITKSAKKGLRKERRNKALNLGYRKRMKDLGKEIASLISAGKTQEAKVLLVKYYKTVDKAAKMGTIKKNTAGRKKSTLAKLLAK